jgi:hypothetical protein
MTARQEFDYVIIRAGSAGCVSQRVSARVLGLMTAGQAAPSRPLQAETELRPS